MIELIPIAERIWINELIFRCLHRIETQLKLLAASCEEPERSGARRSQSSILLCLLFLCSLTPPQAAGNALAGFKKIPRQLCCEAVHLLSKSILSKGCSFLTFSPSFTCTEMIFPARGASTRFFIFIASNTSSLSPFLTS